MTSSIASLRVLVGDALIAAGLAIRGEKFEGNPPALPYDVDTRISCDDVRAALDVQSDSSLFAIAADVIAGGAPADPRAIHLLVLVDVLRDRATQFRVVEADADSPFLGPGDLRAHQTDSPRRGE